LLMGLCKAEKLNDQKMTENKEVWALVVSFKHPWCQSSQGQQV
jgi:hypothetical protein